MGTELSSNVTPTLPATTSDGMKIIPSKTDSDLHVLSEPGTFETRKPLLLPHFLTSTRAHSDHATQPTRIEYVDPAHIDVDKDIDETGYYERSKKDSKLEDTHTIEHKREQARTKMTREKPTATYTHSNSAKEKDKFKDKRRTRLHPHEILRQITTFDSEDKLVGMENYDAWATRLKRILTINGVEDFVTTSLDMIDDEPELKTRIDAAVLETIHVNISRTLQPVIVNNMTAYDAWNKLKSLCTLVDATVEMMIACRQLKEISFEMTTPVAAFFAECESVFFKLDRLGSSLSEKFKCAFVLSKIRDELPEIYDVITSLPFENISMIYIQQKVTGAVELRRLASRQLNIGGPQPDRCRCFRCNCTGHIGKYCPNFPDIH